MTEQRNLLQEALELGQHLKLLQNRIGQNEALLKALKEEYRRVEQEVLPSILEEIGLTSFTLEDGTTVKLEKFPVGRISPAKQDEVFAWLRANHHDGIIKDTINVAFDTGDLKAQAVKDYLMREQLQFTAKEAVHPSTLKAFIREMAEKEDFPRELFSVYEVKRVEFSE